LEKVTNPPTKKDPTNMNNKHTVKKLGNDMYQYRGWLIKKWNNNYLCDDEVRGVQWNTYKTLADYHSGSSMNIHPTLKGAKWSIDYWLNKPEAVCQS